MILAELLPVAGLCGLAVSTFMIGSSISLPVIIISAMLAGVTGVGGMRGSFSAGQQALIANNWKEEKARVQKIGRIVTVASIAAIIGGLLLVFQGIATSILESNTTELIANTLSYRYLFILSALLVLISLACLFFVKEASRERKKHVSIKHESLSYTIKVMSSQILAGLGLGLALPILPAIVAESFSLSSAAASQYIGYVYGLGYILIALSSTYVPRLIYKRKIDTLKVASAARVFQGTLLILLAFSILFLHSNVIAGLAAIGITYAAYSALIGIGAPMRNAINMGGIHANDYGTASAAMGASIQLPQTSSGAAGFLSEAISGFVSLPLAIGGGFIILSGIVYWKLLNGRRKKQ
jgi:hypothetical protein